MAAPVGSSRLALGPCHAEGRGFESLHPLHRTRWKRRFYGREPLRGRGRWVSQVLVRSEGRACCCFGEMSGVELRTSRRKRGGLVSPRAVPRFHRDRRHLSSPGRGRDRSGDDDDNAPYPSHHRGTKTCSAGRDREGGREGDRWLVDSRARSFPGLRGGLDDPQEVHPDPRESLQNMDSLLQVGRIPGFRLLSRRHGVGRGLGPLAQQRERHDPGDLAALANRTRGGRRAPWHRAGRRAWRGRRLAFGRSGRFPCLRPLPPP